MVLHLRVVGMTQESYRKTWRHGLADWLHRHVYWAYRLWAALRPCPCGCTCQSCKLGGHRNRVWWWRV